jgi:transposase
MAGCAWRMLPHDFPKWQTVYDYFCKWKKDGTFENMNTQLSKYVRVMDDRRETPSASILDSQSVQTATMAHEEVGCEQEKERAEAAFTGRHNGFTNCGSCHSSKCH